MIEDMRREQQEALVRRRKGRKRAGRMGMAPSTSLENHFLALARQVEQWAGDRTYPVSIGVTSIESKAGKSSIAYNLSFALTKVLQSNVLLAEADFGKNYITGRMGISSKPGLSELLEGADDSEQAVFETPLERLSVVGCGQKANREVMELPFVNLPRLIADRFGDFGFVVFDLPVAGPLTPCFSIAPKLDGLILAINANEIDSFQIGRVRRQLQAMGAEIIGVVLNQV